MNVESGHYATNGHSLERLVILLIYGTLLQQCIFSLSLLLMLPAYYAELDLYNGQATVCPSVCPMD